VHYGVGIISSESLIVNDVSSACGTVSVASVKGDQEIKLFPDPAVEKLSINYTLKTLSKVCISIHDIHGRLVASLPERNEPAGSYSVFHDVSKLTQGIYVLRLNEKAIKFIKSE
jgi:hypothetical protein